MIKKAGCILINIVNKEISINHYKDSKGNEIENYFYLAIDDGKTEKEIKEKDKEITVWKKYDEVEETLSYQNLKDFWNEIKFEVEKIIANG